MNYYHVKYCASSNRQQHVLSPHMKCDTCKDAQYLRQTVIAAQECDILQAIHYQHTENCTCEVLAQILHELRRMLL